MAEQAWSGGLRQIRGCCLALGLGGLGLLMAHHPTLLSGMRRVQTDLADTRLNNYLLEHAYLWVAGAPGHSDFWSPPFFYPVRNTVAYSDLFLSVAPLYGLGRSIGLPPDTSFQIWMIATSALNYLVALHFLHRRIGVSLPAAGAGAFLFAFGAPRINQMNHQQLLSQFLGLISVDALFGLFPGTGSTPSQRVWLWLAATLGLVAQFYAGFYLGWLLLLAIGITAVIALGWPDTRRVFLATLYRDLIPCGAAITFGCLLMRPLVSHYLLVAREVGTREYWDVSPYIVDWTSLFYMGPDSWLFGWTHQLGSFPPVAEEEKRLGIGLITLVAATLGLLGGRHFVSIRLLVGVSLLLFACVVTVPQFLVLRIALGVALLAMARLFHLRREHPTILWIVPAVILVFLWNNPVARDGIIGLRVFTLVLLLAVVVRGGVPGRVRLIMAIEALLFGFFLFGLEVLLYAGLLGGMVACGAGIIGLRPFWRAGVLAVVVTLVFASLTTYEERPWVLLVGGSAPFCLALTRWVGRPAGGSTVIRGLLIALVCLFVYRNAATAWFALTPIVPGASALRAIARVGMLFLIPWSIGLGLFIQTLLAKAKPVRALAVVLAAVLEQGVTTPSYDKDEHRTAVAALVQKINPRLRAFYYSPHASARPLSACHLDAMWAALETGVPTLNGYSGNFPPDWYLLCFCDIHDECDALCLDAALNRWAGGRNLPLSGVDWIGGPAEWRQSHPLMAHATDTRASWCK